MKILCKGRKEENENVNWRNENKEESVNQGIIKAHGNSQICAIEI